MDVYQLNYREHTKVSEFSKNIDILITILELIVRIFYNIYKS